MWVESTVNKSERCIIRRLWKCVHAEAQRSLKRVRSSSGYFVQFDTSKMKWRSWIDRFLFKRKRASNKFQRNWQICAPKTSFNILLSWHIRDKREMFEETIKFLTKVHDNLTEKCSSSYDINLSTPTYDWTIFTTWCKRYNNFFQKIKSPRL